MHGCPSFSATSPSYQVPSHSEKGGSRVRLFAFHAPQTGSPVVLGVRVGRQAGAVVGCGVVDCVLLLSPGLSVSNNYRKRGSKSPQCPAALRFRELCEWDQEGSCSLQFQKNPKKS